MAFSTTVLPARSDSCLKLRPRSGSKRKGIAPQNIIPSQPTPSPALTAAAHWLRRQLPTSVPLWDEIELAGWTSDTEPSISSFHDWLIIPGGRVVVVAGRVLESPASNPYLSALQAQSIRTALRAHLLHSADPETVLSQASKTLASVGAGELVGELALALVDPLGGEVRLATMGRCLALCVRAAGCRRASESVPPAERDCDDEYATEQFVLRPRERLVLLAGTEPSHTFQAIAAHFGQCTAEVHRRMTAADTVHHVRGACSPTLAGTSTSIVVVRRR